MFEFIGWAILGVIGGAVSLMVVWWLMLIFGKNRNLK